MTPVAVVIEDDKGSMSFSVYTGSDAMFERSLDAIRTWAESPFIFSHPTWVAFPDESRHQDRKVAEWKP